MLRPAPALVLLATLLAAAATPAGACLGPPDVDLWHLAGAERIVVADVETVRPTALRRLELALAKAGNQMQAAVGRVWPDGVVLLENVVDNLLTPDVRPYVAGLTVVETLRGEPARELRIAFDEWGPLFLPGERVVVFFRRDGSALRPLPFHNAVLYPRDAAALEDLRAVLAAAIELQSRSGDAHRHEWAVLAASLPGSREHVLENLARQPLSPGELRAVAASFVSFPAIDRSFERLLALFAAHADAGVERPARALLAAALAEPDLPCWWASSLLEAYLSALGADDERPYLSLCINDEALYSAWLEQLRDRHLPPPGPRELEAVHEWKAWDERLTEKRAATYRRPDGSDE